MLGCYLTCPSKIPTLHTFLKEIAVALPKDFTNQSYNNNNSHYYDNNSQYNNYQLYFVNRGMEILIFNMDLFL